MPNPVPIAKYGLSAKEYYSSGSYHGAYDIPCPTGTRVVAPTNGLILACRNGVKPNRPGYNPGSGAASNWVLLWTGPMPGYPQGVTHYLQHLLEHYVKEGQFVYAGQLIARSDNTGNSTGPHLHWHAMKGKQYDRYANYSDRSVAIYPPWKPVAAWEKYVKGRHVKRQVIAISAKSLALAAQGKGSLKGVRQKFMHAGTPWVAEALGVPRPASASLVFGAVLRRRYRWWQDKLGYRGADADGIPGYASLVKLAAHSGGTFRVVP